MKLIKIILTTFTVSSLFIACGTEEAETTENETTVNLNGASFGVNCSSCHALCLYIVSGVSATDSNAIANQPSMANINLTNDEIDAISSA